MLFFAGVVMKTFEECINTRKVGGLTIGEPIGPQKWGARAYGPNRSLRLCSLRYPRSLPINLPSLLPRLP